MVEKFSNKDKKITNFSNHFFGIAEITREDYKIIIQGRSMLREKLIKLPIKFKNHKALLRLSGINANCLTNSTKFHPESIFTHYDSPIALRLIDSYSTSSSRLVK